MYKRQVSTLLGSIAAIGIFNLKARSRKAIGFVNSIPILNGDITVSYTHLHDQVLDMLKYLGMGNRPEDKVKVIFVPC